MALAQEEGEEDADEEEEGEEEEEEDDDAEEEEDGQASSHPLSPAGSWRLVTQLTSTPKTRTSTVCPKPAVNDLLSKIEPSHSPTGGIPTLDEINLRRDLFRPHRGSPSRPVISLLLSPKLSGCVPASLSLYLSPCLLVPKPAGEEAAEADAGSGAEDGGGADGYDEDDDWAVDGEGEGGPGLPDGRGLFIPGERGPPNLSCGSPFEPPGAGPPGIIQEGPGEDWDLDSARPRPRNTDASDDEFDHVFGPSP